MFHHAMRGDTLSHSIETIIWLMMIIWSDPSMFHDGVSPWSLHIYHYEAMQGQGPHFPPTRKATIHIHRGEGGKGVKMGTLHWGGGGGGLAKPGSYIPDFGGVYYFGNNPNSMYISSFFAILNASGPSISPSFALILAASGKFAEFSTSDLPRNDKQLSVHVFFPTSIAKHKL